MEDINNDYTNLSRNQIITRYLENLQQLKHLATQNCHVSGRQFDNFMFLQYFNHNRNGLSSNNVSIKAEILKQIMDRKRKIIFWIFYLIIAVLFVSYKNEASTIILRNIQTFIYPGMKIWRKMTLPVINKFPGLTELYDESCLMMNPFFQVDDLNCEPCAGVINVLDLTQFEQTTEFVPFIFKIEQDPVYVSDLYELYETHKDVFHRDAYRVTSSNREISNMDELFYDFNRTNQAQSHSLWRCNRMPPARILRQLFMRPGRLPATGIALERHLAIDTSDAPSYAIPDAECSNMFIQQALGTRTIILRPTTECRHKCRTISIRLPQSFVYPTDELVEDFNLFIFDYTLTDHEIYFTASTEVEVKGFTVCGLQQISDVKNNQGRQLDLVFTIDVGNSVVEQSNFAHNTIDQHHPLNILPSHDNSVPISYNWWYWRPISAPDQLSKSTSISLIGSYC